MSDQKTQRPLKHPAFGIGYETYDESFERVNNLSSKPATWIGLTDDERRQLRKRNQQHDAFAIAVEALLKQKNGYNK